MDLAALFSKSSTAPQVTLVIFRKEFTEELAKKIAEEAEQDMNSKIKNKVIKGQMPMDADHLCPNCNSKVNSRDDSCWKCNADFGERSAWRPIPIK